MERNEEFTSNEDKKNFQANRPGAKTGDAAGNDGKLEPGKYKGFLERFQSELRKITRKATDK